MSGLVPRRSFLQRLGLGALFVPTTLPLDLDAPGVVCPEPLCANTNVPDARFCSRCGRRIQGEPEPKIWTPAEDAAAKAVDAGFRIGDLYHLKLHNGTSWYEINAYLRQYTFTSPSVEVPGYPPMPWRAPVPSYEVEIDLGFTGAREVLSFNA